MAKKATLDILDIKIDDVQKDDPVDEPGPEKGAGETPGQLSRLLTMLGQKCRGRLFWALAAGVGLLIAAAALVLLFHEEPADRAPVVPQKAPLAGTAKPMPDNTILLSGFVVDLKDDRGAASKVIFCDVALDLERPQKEEAGRGWVETRNLIHATLKRKKVRELLLPEDRSRLKIELKEQLNTLLGGNSVKEVYFTRFEIF